uniref:Putative glutathione-dependent formaldehyde-activating GFA n=2 Tax=Rhizobium rhizogenes TaxID=359 RepID=A0A7S5DS21_RHIRH|nr:putative glutathione-dependent formaldehyde-activating GFA [Rhizobium rhizogenes]
MPDFKPGVTAIALGCFDKAETLWPSQCVNEDQQYAWVELHLPSA